MLASHREQVTETEELIFVLYFFCKNVGGIGDAWDVLNIEFMELLDGFANFIFADLNLVGAFGIRRLAPVNTALIVVEQRGGTRCVV